MDKNHTDIEALKASLSQSGSTYSPERLQADIQSLSSTGASGTTPQVLCNDGKGVQRTLNASIEPRRLNFTQDENDDN